MSCFRERKLIWKEFNIHIYKNSFFAYRQKAKVVFALEFPFRMRCVREVEVWFLIESNNHDHDEYKCENTRKNKQKVSDIYTFDTFTLPMKGSCRWFCLRGRPSNIDNNNNKKNSKWNCLAMITFRQKQFNKTTNSKILIANGKNKQLSEQSSWCCLLTKILLSIFINTHVFSTHPIWGMFICQKGKSSFKLLLFHCKIRAQSEDGLNHLFVCS